VKPRTLVGVNGKSLDLDYFVEWRQYLWSPLLLSILSRRHFKDKKVLEIGTRYGKMACLFALLGAEVVAIDIVDSYLESAREEARKWNVSDKIEFLAYTGNLQEIPYADFDYVFTKSVLVVVPDLSSFLKDIKSKLAPSGELIALENLKGGRLLRLVRNTIIHRTWNVQETFYAVDDAFVERFRQVFPSVTRKDRLGLVASITAVV
jgi:ubiquinone/menaquinone biosynthesis C-methylase UbiE